ncbi:MAG: styrene monooxygenase/indole monooxygenase family protein [Pseudomonadota bacterium]|nr:styrene monooxygenase/indole monooxygenase family protein [Pseudomonadota bacterium]
MKSIAIIGAGPVGLHLGFALLKASGFKVTIFSDRTPEQYGDAKLSNTAAFFSYVQGKEQELGINFWDDVTPRGKGIHLEAHLPTGDTIASIDAAFRDGVTAQGVDYRIRIPRWMQEFSQRGGDLRVESIDAGRLDEIAGEFDATFVAVGKGAMSRLFSRDEERSEFDRPARHMGVLLLEGQSITGPDAWPEVGFPHLRLHTIFGVGDVFSIPMYGKPGVACRGMAFEAIPGSPFDQFSEAASGDDLLQIGLDLMRKYLPGDVPEFSQATLCEPGSWIVGALTPTIRKPVGYTESGHAVMGLGDVVMLTDPLAGQGANNGIRMVHRIAEELVDLGSKPVEADWMHRAFEDYWDDYGQYPIEFTNRLLKDPGPPLMVILQAAGSDQRVADAFATAFTDPKTMVPWLRSVEDAKRFVTQAQQSASPPFRQAV